MEGILVATAAPPGVFILTGRRHRINIKGRAIRRARIRLLKNRRGAPHSFLNPLGTAAANTLWPRRVDIVAPLSIRRLVNRLFEVQFLRSARLAVSRFGLID